MSECCQNIAENVKNVAKEEIKAKIEQSTMLPKCTVLFYILLSLMFGLLLSFIPDVKRLIMGVTKSPRSFIAYGPRPEPEILKDSIRSLMKSSRRLPKPELKGEALATLHLAKDMTKLGKTDKALKLYEHAIALDYTHPDILNEYGEFLESNVKDVVLAEHMYCRALIISPTHNKALVNRQRTLPLVEEIDMKAFTRIEVKRQHLLKVPSNHPGLRRQKKESYYQYLHHTTAIEGNTFTLSQARALVETSMAIPGKNIQEHNEILGMDLALSFVNQSLVHRIGAITVQDVLEIHRRVLGHVDPVEAGRFRNTQVFVSDYTPPAAPEVAALMDEFVAWLNTPEALELQPIELAALAHYKLVIIHPFYDGNGRTARLLMNLILMQAGYPPVTIQKAEKHEYFQYLDTANAGDVRPFIRFIARCTERTLDEYLWATQTNSTGSLTRTQPDEQRTIILDEL